MLPLRNPGATAGGAVIPAGSHDAQVIEFRRFFPIQIPLPLGVPLLAQQFDRPSSPRRFEQFASGDLKPLVHPGQLQHRRLRLAHDHQRCPRLEPHVGERDRRPGQFLGGLITCKGATEVALVPDQRVLMPPDLRFESHALAVDPGEDDLPIALGAEPLLKDMLKFEYESGQRSSNPQGQAPPPAR